MASTSHSHNPITISFRRQHLNPQCPRCWLGLLNVLKYLRYSGSENKLYLLHFLRYKPQIKTGLLRINPYTYIRNVYTHAHSLHFVG
jgi:hypothetical protein